MELPANPEEKKALAEDDRWALVQRIVTSTHFQKALQLRDILLYLCRRALEENPSAISEYEVGFEALGRRQDFNTHEDNIVRVQVRHLRRKLEDYFSAEGQDEPILITIPKGTYVPRFDRRSEPVPAPPNGGLPQEPPAPVSVAPSQPVAPAIIADPPAVPAAASHPWRLTAGLAAILLIAGTAVLLWSQRDALRRSDSGSDRSPATEDFLWSRMFAPGQQTTVVVADTCLVMLQDILDTDIRLTEYLSGAYPLRYVDSVRDPKLHAALKLIVARQYTSLGDLTVAAKVLEMGHRRNAVPRIRYGRYLDMRELKTGNFVLVGSRRGIPWIQLFEPQLNFFLEQDPKTRKFNIRNKAPRPGEQVVYGTSANGESYAAIALLPNLSGTGYVLILAGITMEMTEAAGDLVASPEFTAALARMVKSKPSESAPFQVEVLIQAKSLAGAARAAKIVTHRVVVPPKAEPL